MPVKFASSFFSPLPVKVYRGWYGETARHKIQWSQRAKGFRAAFPDC